MEYVLSFLSIYALLMISGFPAVFFLVFMIWSWWTERRIESRSRKLLSINILVYPLVLVGFMILIVTLFSVDTEAWKIMTRMDELSSKAILNGASPNGQNPILGWLFVSILYFGIAMIPGVLVGLVYSVISTFGIFNIKSEAHGMRPFLVSAGICVVIIGLAYLFRTPIFNFLIS